MRRSRPSQIGVLLGAVALFTGSCSDDGGGSADTRVPTSPASSAETTTASTSLPAEATSTSTAPSVDVTVQKDVAYDTGDVATYDARPLMNVYAPADADGLPLVVLFHGGGANKDAPAVYHTLSKAIAARGAVVAVPNWDTGSALMPQAAENVALARCAIGFAVAHATEWGADPSGVTLVGHSGGANVASVIAFDQATQPPGCPAATWDIDGVILWEGDWALADPTYWDEYGDQVTPVIPVMTPWKILDGWTGPVTFLVTANAAQAMSRCDDIATWLPMRDAEGTIRAALEAIGATEDGCIDVGEESKALAQVMTDAGIANSYVELTGATSNHTHLSKDDVELFADEVYALVAPTS